MRVHIISSPINISSGFSIVARNLGIELNRLGYDVSFTGLTQSHGSDIYYGIMSYPLLGTNLDEISQLVMNIKDTEPDIILNIFQADSGNFSQHAMIFDTVNRLNEAAGVKDKQGNIKKIKSYWYVPVESLGLAYNSIRDLNLFIKLGGKIVAQCKWGQNEMKKEGIDAGMIYHGVDNSIFREMDEKEIRGKYNIANGAIKAMRRSNDCRILGCAEPGKWGEETILVDQLFKIHKGRFVFLVIAANVGVRKRIERAMRAYSILLNGSVSGDGVSCGNQQLKDRTLLHIHTQPFNPEGIRIMEIAEKLGIEKNVIISYSRWKKGWTDMEMSILHNSCDCYLSASSGEGFGLDTLFSMACGKPVIGPRNTSFIELVEEEVKCQSLTAGLDTAIRTIGPRGLLANGDYQLIIDGSYRFLVNEEKLAEAMGYMYGWKAHGSDKYGTFKNNCLKFAKRYTWDKMALEWDRLFKNEIV